MAGFLAPWHDPLKPNSGPDLSRFVDRRDFDTLSRRVDGLERAIRSLETSMSMRPMNDTIYLSSTRHTQAEYGDVAGTIHNLVPYISTASRIVADLTSSETSKRTFHEALLTAGGLTALAALLAALGLAPLYAVPATATVSFTLVVCVLVLDNRSTLRRVIRQQDKNLARYGEMTFTVKQEDDSDPWSRMFARGDVTREDLRALAQDVLAGGTLTVHAQSCTDRWPRPKYDHLMKELQKMGYVRAGRGNKPRELTRKGRALFRAWAE